MPQSGLISSPAKPLNACFSGMEFSPALLVRRPDGTWVAIGPELDGIARFISDIAIPNPRDRHGTPRRTPRQPDRTSSRAVHPGAQRHRGRPGHSGSRRGRRLGLPPRHPCSPNRSRTQARRGRFVSGQPEDRRCLRQRSIGLRCLLQDPKGKPRAARCWGP